MLISTENTNQNGFGNGNYLDVSRLPENEIESPAHAWNAICIAPLVVSPPERFHYFRA